MIFMGIAPVKGNVITMDKTPKSTFNLERWHKVTAEQWTGWWQYSMLSVSSEQVDGSTVC